MNKLKEAIYSILMVVLGLILSFVPAALIDYYLFAPYWILVAVGVPLIFFLVLVVLIDLFGRRGEASGFAVAAGSMLANFWMLTAPALIFIVPYYIGKYIWLAL